MKKKILLSSLTLLTVSPVFVLVSCQNNQTNQQVEKETELNKLVEKLKTDKTKTQRKTEQELTDLNKKLNDANQENLNFETKNAELNEKLEELSKEVEKLSGTKIQRNQKSAKDLFLIITNFLTEDLPNAIKLQNPTSFESNSDLFNRIKSSVLDTKENLKDTPEDFANLWTWESAILFTLNRASLVNDYIDDPRNPVTVITPKSPYMDDLFNWRIHDLELIIDQVNKNTYEQNEKEKILKQLQEIKQEYENAKNNSSLLSHQISSWYKLEQESEQGVVGKFINLKSEHNRSLLPSLKLPQFKISLFPVYKQIIDEDFKEKTKNKLSSLLRDYQFLLNNKASSFINSVSYDRLNKKIKKVALELSAALLSNNIDYFNEFQVWKDVDTFVLDAKSILLEAFFVETDKKKMQMDEEVDNQLNETKDGSLAKEFKETYEAKSKLKNNEAKYLYKDFYTKYNKLINNIKNDSHNDYTQSFDRYTKYLVLKRELELAKQIINLHTDLNEDLDNVDLKELLKWDNSAKYDNQIRTAQKNKERDEESYTQQKEKINELIVEFDEENDQASDYIESASEKAKEISELFITNFDPTIDEHNNVKGIWGHMYGDYNSNKIINLMRDYNKLVQTINKNYKDDQYDEDELKQKAKEIFTSSQNVKKILFGDENDQQDDDNLSIYGKFNKAHEDFNYGEVDTTVYDSQVSIIRDYQELLNYLANFANQDKDDIDTEKLTKELQIKIQFIKLKLSELENIYTEQGKWKDLSSAEEEQMKLLDSVKDTLKTNLMEIQEVIEELITPSDENEEFEIDGDKLVELAEKANEFLTSIGTLYDGFSPLTSLYETTISDYETNIRRATKKKENIPQTAKILSGQEIFVLLRYWKNTQETNFNKILLDDKTYQDKELAKFLHQETKFATQTRESYRNILKVDGSENSFDVEEQENQETPITAKTIYQEFNDLETKYAKSLLTWFKDHSENNKNDLLETRKKYYEYLNSFKDKNIYLSNSYIRFGSDLYIYDENEPDEHVVAAHFLDFYIKTQAVTDIMENLYEKYIK
ncbi:hypothetical protein [Mycoplasma miroungirhinis]|uniref:Lipoprotein n=1 Tax=Mycoplasma miroungirhinis TaxID=754516 RepID=A0A6M4JAF9_9MOLU|nr:hypothetical protein [Mycoplasma miroungirhinis]QJR43880.1 hypothetical protein HLA92_00160 [Mycoplasma miroungirhinis]